MLHKCRYFASVSGWSGPWGRYSTTLQLAYTEYLAHDSMAENKSSLNRGTKESHWRVSLYILLQEKKTVRRFPHSSSQTTHLPGTRSPFVRWQRHPSSFGPPVHLSSPTSQHRDTLLQNTTLVSKKKMEHKRLTQSMHFWKKYKTLSSFISFLLFFNLAVLNL